jgi:hypothetical protein
VSPVKLTDGRGGVEEVHGGGEGAKSYGSEKAWSYINHSIVSGPTENVLEGKMFQTIGAYTGLKGV